MMGDRDEVIEAKLEILVKDFQRFRDTQELACKEQYQVNASIAEHSAHEDSVQAKILTTLRWHNVIGSGAITVLAFIGLRVLS